MSSDTGTSKPKPFIEVIDGVLHVHPHEGQQRALESDKQIVAMFCGKQSGKCVRIGSKVTLADGTRKNIEDVVSGDTTLSMSDDFKIVESKVTRLIDSGTLPVYEVVTTSGRRIEVSETHPFFTKDGWKELKDIGIKDFIAVPRILPVEGSKSYDKNWLKLIGYFLGDGGISQNNVHFTNADPIVIEDFSKSVPESCTVSHTGKYGYNVIHKKRKPVHNEVKKFLIDIGMMGHTAHTKSIPDFVFSLNNECVAIVINRLFACDGWVDTNGIGYTSVSKKMIYDVQHLLLRFGIISRIRHRYSKCNGKTFPNYAMAIIRKSDLLRFQKHVGIFSKDDKLAALIRQKNIEKPNDMVPYNTDVLYERIPRINKRGQFEDIYRDKYDLLRSSRAKNIERTKLQKIANEFDDDYLKNLSNSDIFWDQVKSIEYVGDHQCYDLEIENTHNFIANDIFVHNSSVCPLWLYHRILDWDKRVHDDKEVLPSDVSFWAVSPSFPLQEEKLQPIFYEFFVSILGIGRYHVQKKKFDVNISHEDGEVCKYEIRMKSGDKVESLASATVAAMVLDEAGQDSFSQAAWEECRARLGSTGGRALITTTLYNYGWCKRLIYDEWRKGNPNIDVIQFESRMNPFFSKEEWDNAKRMLPAWKFDMSYCGKFTRPLGRIYQDFDDSCIVEPFDIPSESYKYVGVDPGIRHHSTVFLAEIYPNQPDYKRFPLADGVNPVYVIYDSNIVGSTTTTITNQEHAEALRQHKDYNMVRIVCGGAKSEIYMREDYKSMGVDIIEPPYKEVSAGINTVTSMLKTHQLYVCRDQERIIKEFEEYSYKLDREGNVIPIIENKEIYHGLDGVRYICLAIKAKQVTTTPTFLAMSGKSLYDIV